ncbi:MAG: hypothetical protein ACI83O_000928 [Patescibacteria group bacterium]|jgi:hypothetical protein
MVGRKVVVRDSFQDGYIYYCTEPVGENFSDDFTPGLTPKEMLDLGVFGGKYLNDCRGEFPDSWFISAKVSFVKNIFLNFFKVDASKSLSYWVSKGWIHSDDPRGWFQWYCRYYMGRRCEDDIRQIKRFRAMNRHIAQLVKACPVGALECRPRQRQALLHWAIDSREL